MATIERAPGGRFSKGNPGRPKGSANKLTANFKQMVQSTLETMGQEVTMRRTLGRSLS